MKKARKIKKPSYKEVTDGQIHEKKDTVIEQSKGAEKKDFAREQNLELSYGIGETNFYGVSTVKDLKEKLDSMRKADMEEMAAKIGVNPFYDRDILIVNIITEFRKFLSRNDTTIDPTPKPVLDLDPNNPRDKEILDMFRNV